MGGILSRSRRNTAGTARSTRGGDFGEDPIGRSLEQHKQLARSLYPRQDGHSLRLPGGRRLGYMWYGNMKAENTILFLHGIPGTRFFWHARHTEICLQANVRVLVPERPGFGLSSPCPGRTILSNTQDIKALLDHLQIASVAVVGYWTGGPYALALAHELPGRISRVAVVSSPSPPWRNKLNSVTDEMSVSYKRGYWIARNIPFVLPFVMWWRSALSNKDPFRPSLGELTSEENIVFRNNAGIRALYAQSELELYSRGRGTRTEAEEYALMAKPWGFKLGAIAEHIPVVVCTGELDRRATPSMYRMIAGNCPNVSKESHFGIGKGHLYFYEIFPSIIRELGF
jgi:pimeloyl-ACP methyl ester carboxylesterase